MAKMDRLDRPLGQVPEWAKTGPISLRNYPYRAEAHCAAQATKRGGTHPTIERGTPAFALWRQYFERHLGGIPHAMERLLEADPGQRTMTVPEAEPQWFDPSFEPDPGYVEGEYVAPIFPARKYPPLPEYPPDRPSRGPQPFKRLSADELRAFYQPRPPQEETAA